MLRVVLTVVLGSTAAFCWYGLSQLGRFLEAADEFEPLQRSLVDPDAEDAEKEATHLTVV
jgi:hypothetical protein